MAAVNAIWTLPEQKRIELANKVETDITNSSVRLNTAFVGSIPDGLIDETVEKLLSTCGPINKWKRVLDASNMPKSFGFCEFASADAMGRALDLLHDLPMTGGKKLIVKVDDATKSYLEKYKEALEKDQVEASSKEADLAAMKEISALFKEKSLYSAMEVIEKKISILTAEAPEEGEAIESEDDEKKTKYSRNDYSRSRSRGGREKNRTTSGSRSRSRSLSSSRTRRHSRDHQVDARLNEALKAFKDREQRWMAREAQMIHRSKRDEQAEADRLKAQKEESEYANKYLSSFDDFDWLQSSLDRMLGIDRKWPCEGRVPDFYANRELWKSRRKRDKEREEEYDKKDEEAEREEIERELEKQKKEAESLMQKRSRPRAAEFIQETAVEKSELQAKRRKPLIARDYTKEELLNAGMSEQEALTKLKDLYKEKVSRLIAMIPQEREELFVWVIEWKYFDHTKMLTWIHKKVSDALARQRRSDRDANRIAQSLIAQIQQHAPPSTIIAWVVEDRRLINDRSSSAERKEEATTFVAILWRYLVFETEAASFNLVMPQ